MLSPSVSVLKDGKLEGRRQSSINLCKSVFGRHTSWSNLLGSLENFTQRCGGVWAPLCDYMYHWYSSWSMGPIAVSMFAPAHSFFIPWYHEVQHCVKTLMEPAWNLKYGCEILCNIQFTEGVAMADRGRWVFSLLSHSLHLSFQPELLFRGVNMCWGGWMAKFSFYPIKMSPCQIDCCC